MTDPLACGDLIAYRRYAYGRAAAEDGDWAVAALKALRDVSPSALHWTLRALRRGRDLTLKQALDAEFALTRATMAHPDFAEGVRAMVVDKDRAPRWQPARIEAVDPAVIDALFTNEPPGYAPGPNPV